MPENSDSVGRRFESCLAYQNAVKSYDFTAFLYKIVQIICFYCIAQPDSAFWGNSLDLQTALHDLAGGFLVFIERVGVDVQCSRCGILKQGVPKDIDKYVDEILDKM